MAFKKFTASHSHMKPDPKYHSDLVQKFINCIMIQGKKSVANRVFDGAMDIIAKKVKDVPAIDVFTQAVENVKPYIEVRSKRVGGATYQVPMQVNQRRRLSLAIRWIREAARALVALGARAALVKGGSPAAARSPATPNIRMQ